MLANISYTLVYHHEIILFCIALSLYIGIVTQKSKPIFYVSNYNKALSDHTNSRD